MPEQTIDTQAILAEILIPAAKEIKTDRFAETNAAHCNGGCRSDHGCMTG